MCCCSAGAYEYIIVGAGSSGATLAARLSEDAQHIAGTCRMGRADDARSVVDPECRVLDTEGLRVIDASIMPSVPRANRHLTCVMIGELMADRLRGIRN